MFKQGKSEIHIFDAASGSDSDYDDEGVNSLTSEGDLTKIIENSTSKADLVKIQSTPRGKASLRREQTITKA